MAYREEFNDAHKEAKWTMWKVLPTLLTVIVILSVIGFTMRSCGLIGRTVVERKVFENSFQYSEARKTEMLTYEAQLSEIERKLRSNISQSTRDDLEAQAAGIRIMLYSAENK